MSHRIGSACPHPRRGSPRLPTVLCAAITITGLSVLIGCHTGPTAPETASGVFSGPAIHLESEGGHHLVVVTSSSPGWRARVDRVEDRFGYERVFVSLREPDPRAAYAQGVVEQRLITPVLSDAKTEVWARTLAYDAPLDTDAAYRLVPGTHH